MFEPELLIRVRSKTDAIQLEQMASLQIIAIKCYRMFGRNKLHWGKTSAFFSVNKNTVKRFAFSFNLRLMRQLSILSKDHKLLYC